jgi:O-antigen ligase
VILISNFIDSPQHWLQGFGLGQVVHDMTKAGFPHSSAHNDYLEIGYTYGFLGMFLWFGSMVDMLLLSKSNYLKNKSPLISHRPF